MKKGLLIVLGVVLLVGLWAGSVYNGLVTSSEAVPAAWSQVQTVLQRRYDLIPNLVNTVKGYAKHEKELLTEVTRLRSQWGEAKTPGQQMAAASGMESALSRLMVVVEQYPQLKANENFIRLMDELAGTENRISVERRSYNETVNAYNVTVRRFPTNLVAGMFGFKKAENYFAGEKEAQQAPKVQF
ncbi:MAG: LemA family protein [Elusimicrobiota bacterium]